MKKSNITKSLILAAAVSLGLAASASADVSEGTQVPNPAAPAGHGLLGQSYAELGYSYHDLQGTNINAHTYSLTLNQGVGEGLDTLFQYSDTFSSEVAGGRISQRLAAVGARAYTNYRGIKPYAEAGLGWVWQKAPFGLRDNSFAYFVGVGAEFQVAPDVSITPFVRYLDATKRSFDHEWDYGVKANYWFNERFGVSATITRTNSRDMEYGLGVSVRY